MKRLNRDCTVVARGAANHSLARRYGPRVREAVVKTPDGADGAVSPSPESLPVDVDCDGPLGHPSFARGRPLADVRGYLGSMKYNLFAAILFSVAAVVFFVGGSVAMGAVFVAVGAVFAGLAANEGDDDAQDQ
ncbi:MAG: hypothetical protein L0H31_11380 [Nocardioidaceae bacterium]|nr:hypothetical protein [Nocardioidaceae bacterium]